MLSFVIVVMVRRVCDFFVFYVFCSVGFYVFCSVGFSFICFDSEYVEFYSALIVWKIFFFSGGF